MNRITPLALALPLAGCGPMLSTMTPAQVTPHRSVRAAAGMGIGLPVGQIIDAIDTATTLAERVSNNQPLTADEQNTLTAQAVGLVISPPTYNYELQARYGFYPRWDAGLRLVGSNVRLDGRFLVLDAAHGAPLDLSVGLGLGLGLSGISLGSVLGSVISVDDYRVFAVDVPVLAGWSGRFGHFWFGAKVVAAFQHTGMSVRVSSSELRVLDVSGSTVHYGGVVGGAVGYRWVWVAAELSVLGMSGGADITWPGGRFAPSFGGVVFAPSFAVLVQI
ncbi:MAG: hypothetical protein U0324_34640 [Polyangiales bacterium]